MSKKNLSLKGERFRNVAGRRVKKLLDTIDSLSKCANKGNYEYNDADVEMMMEAIKSKIKLLESSYQSNTKTTKNTFKFH